MILQHGPKGVMERLTEKVKYNHFEKMLRARRQALVEALEAEGARRQRERPSSALEEEWSREVDYLRS